MLNPLQNVSHCCKLLRTQNYYQSREKLLVSFVVRGFQIQKEQVEQDPSLNNGSARDGGGGRRINALICGMFHFSLPVRKRAGLSAYDKIFWHISLLLL